MNSILISLTVCLCFCSRISDSKNNLSACGCVPGCPPSAHCVHFPLGLMPSARGINHPDTTVSIGTPGQRERERESAKDWAWEGGQEEERWKQEQTGFSILEETDRQVWEGGLRFVFLGKNKQTATLLVFFQNQQGLWRCQQMHNATGRHLVADHQLSTTHTHTFTMCVMGQSFFFTLNAQSIVSSADPPLRNSLHQNSVVSFSLSLPFLPGMGESEYFIIRNGHVLTYS